MSKSTNIVVRKSDEQKGLNSGMISLFNACCSSILSRTGNIVTKSPSCGCFSLSWKTSFQLLGVRTVNLKLLSTGFRVQWYSSKDSRLSEKSGTLEKSSGGSSRKPKSHRTQAMKDKEEFFVVRKGDLIGVYKSLSDCQAQVGTSICDPPVSVYKGQSMPKDTERYLVSCGLQNPLYSIKASDLTPELFGTLVPCPVQPSSSRCEISSEPKAKKRSQEALWSEYGRSCTLEFDGASKGNPGQAGAGAIVRSDDGNLICKLRAGLGIATNNVAEYRGFILGLRYALGKGFTDVRVRGDSKLVCMQIQGQWKVKNHNISTLYDEAKKLKDRFLSFQIIHILRDLNSEADVQANLGVNLAEGQIQEEIDK